MDTSSFGGYFDTEFAEASKGFFNALFVGQVIALISDTLVAELVDAPERVQDLLEQVLEGDSERLESTQEVKELQEFYLKAGVLSRKWSDDALHVAHASVAKADVIVSWNFKHLVNPARIHGFNQVNSENGYGPVIIMTPNDISLGMEAQSDEENE